MDDRIEVKIDTGEAGWHYLGSASVDSGQLMIVDPCYVIEGLDYDAVNAATSRVWAVADGRMESFAPGEVNLGAAFPSGLGDGLYPVYAKVEEIKGWGHRIVGVWIDLLCGSHLPDEDAGDDVASGADQHDGRETV